MIQMKTIQHIKILDRYEDNEAIETLYAKSAVISALLTGQKKSKVELIAFQNLPVAMQLGVVRGLFDIYLNIEIKKLTKDREELPKIGPGLSGLDGIETATAIPGGSDLGAKDNFPGLRLVLPPQYPQTCSFTIIYNIRFKLSIRARYFQIKYDP